MTTERRDHDVILSLVLPTKLYLLYYEIVTAYNEKLDLLCCAGLRMFLEGVCDDKGIARYHSDSFRDMRLSDRIAALEPYTEKLNSPWKSHTNSQLIRSLIWVVQNVAIPAIHGLRMPDDRSTLANTIMVIERWLIPALYIEPKDITLDITL